MALYKLEGNIGYSLEGDPNGVIQVTIYVKKANGDFDLVSTFPFNLLDEAIAKFQDAKATIEANSYLIP